MQSASENRIAMASATNDTEEDRMDHGSISRGQPNSNKEAVSQSERMEQRLSQHSISEQSSVESEKSGYISIKDFAYDASDPLYHGYTSEFQGALQPDTDASGVDYNGEDSHIDINGSGNLNKRESVVLPTDYVINRLAVALYDFEPENDNELGLQEGDIVFISYRHGQGWLVAENQNRTKTGLVPEEFVTYVNEDDEKLDEYEEDFQDTARPFYLTHFIIQGMRDPSSGGHSTDSTSNSISNMDQRESFDGDEEEDNRQSSDDSRQSGSNHNDEWEDIDQFQEDLADKLKISSASDS